MLLREIDVYLRDTLNLTAMDAIDNALNGLQVSRSKEEISRVAFAVDACLETFHRAAENNAAMLFVHHGLFWGKSLALTGSHFERIRYLIENDIALYAAHLPLDIHPALGNNAGIAKRLALRELEPFGNYRGVCIGYKGALESPMALDAIIERLGFDRQVCASILELGPKNISTVGIVSGGATGEIHQAVDERLDLYITGESSHSMYHLCMEEEISLLAGGHYQTETFGVKSMEELMRRETGVETVFIDVPTGL